YKQQLMCWGNKRDTEIGCFCPPRATAALVALYIKKNENCHIKIENASRFSARADRSRRF
ncbi:MAG TPA: hypothetical protein VED67_02805, partial [Thermodesulfovibrionales bacterium]|nr:hypothetical protein [Thermodesulfovibrionales bacterium]